MASILVRNIPDELLAGLRRRAAEHKRSMQREVLDILVAAAYDNRRCRSRDLAEELARELLNGGRVFDESVDLIRADRER